MQCPNCSSTLTMTERQGIEIDYCPSCRGVWLDRGELDKIIERSAGQQAAAQPSSQHAPPQQQWGNHDDRYGHPHPHGRHKRRKSFLEELFD